MTQLELEQAELIVHCLPRIANALESIAKSLEVLNANHSEQQNQRDEYGKAGD